MLSGCDRTLSSIITPDPSSYKSDKNRLFGDQPTLKAKAEQLGKNKSADYACGAEPKTWMNISNHGGDAMVSNNAVSGLTFKYSYLECSVTGNIKTCKAGELNQVIDKTTGHVVFTEDGTDFKLECAPATK